MSEYDDETGEIYNLSDLNLCFANIPIKDENDFVRGQLNKISLQKFAKKIKRTQRDLADDMTYDAFVFEFFIESTGDKPIKMKILTGTIMSSKKTYIKAKGRGKTKEEAEYSKLTELLLRLKLATIEEISSYDNEVKKEIVKRMNEVVKKPIHFKSKLKIQEDMENLETLNERTIETIKPFEFKNLTIN